MKRKIVLTLMCFVTTLTGMAQVKDISLNQGWNCEARVYNDTLFVATDNGLFAYDLKEENAVWKPYAFSGMTILNFVKDGDSFLVISVSDQHRTLLRSLDKGVTVTDITPSDTHNGYSWGGVLDIRQIPNDPKHVFVVYPMESDANHYSTMLESVDFGAQWTPAGKSDSHAGTFAVDSDNASHVLVYGLPREYNCVCPYILETFDSFQTLTNVAFVGDKDMFIFADIAFSPADSQRLIAAMDCGIAKSVDGGLTWQFSKDVGSNFTHILFDAAHPQRAYALRYSSTYLEEYGNVYDIELFRSTDAGDSWDKVYSVDGDVTMPERMLLYGNQLLLVGDKDKIVMLDTNQLTPTAILMPTAQPMDNHPGTVFYDLGGRKVKDAKNGTYIQNGKKIVVK